MLSQKKASQGDLFHFYIIIVLLIMRSYHETLLGKHCVLLRITIIQPTSTTQIHTQLHFNKEKKRSVFMPSSASQYYCLKYKFIIYPDLFRQSLLSTPLCQSLQCTNI